MTAVAAPEPIRWQRVELRLQPYGDSALLVTAAGGTGEARWRAAQHLADLVEVAQPAGLEGLVATYDRLLVEFDCAVTSWSEIDETVRGVTRTVVAGTGPAGQEHRIPVVYGGADGPDLPGVADELGMSVDEVVRRHSAAPWVVRFLGAPAGAPMLDGSPFPAQVSRHPRPRVRVPAGSVAVAGHQGVIYPVSSPGGWRLIGRTPLRLVDVRRRPRPGYRAGDRFRFLPVNARAAGRLGGDLGEPGHG